MGAVTAIVNGIAILVCVIGFASFAVGGATVRLAALVGSVGVMLVVWGVRDLKVLRPR